MFESAVRLQPTFTLSSSLSFPQHLADLQPTIILADEVIWLVENGERMNVIR